MRSLLDSLWELFELALPGIVMLLGVGAVVGLLEALTYFDTGGCRYQNIAAYAPSRAFVCELMRKRWPEN